MAEAMGLREFGRSIGLSGEAIRKAIKTGRIPKQLIGETILSTGRSRPTILNPVAAAAALNANTSPNYRQDGAAISAGKKAAGANVAQLQRQQAATEPPLQTSARAPSIADSRAITEAYKARLAKLEYEEKSGKLVNGDDVKVRMATMITSARSRLMGVPSKAKSRIPHLTVEEIAMLDELVREALEDCAIGR